MSENKKLHAMDKESWLSKVYDVLNESENRYLDLDDLHKKDAELQQEYYDDAKSAMDYIAEELNVDLNNL